MASCCLKKRPGGVAQIEIGAGSLGPQDRSQTGTSLVTSVAAIAGTEDGDALDAYQVDGALGMSWSYAMLIQVVFVFVCLFACLFVWKITIDTWLVLQEAYSC